MTEQPRQMVEAMVAERGKVHGDFTDVGRVAQELKDVCRRAKNWPTMLPFQREAVDMIMHKAARILVGDPHHHDHWDDVEGYAHITSVRIPQAAMATVDHLRDHIDQLRGTPLGTPLKMTGADRGASGDRVLPEEQAKASES